MNLNRNNYYARRRSPVIWIIGLVIILLLTTGYLAFRVFRVSDSRTALVLAWLRDPFSRPDWMVKAGQRCGEAPFIQPADGFIGYLWNDSFRIGHKHQGIDVFSGKPAGESAIIAVYPGYLTRLPDWKSSVIIRIPDDPLHPGQQIWAYYTHMAHPDGKSLIAPEFPPGTNEVYVEAGTFLGYQGNYSGTPGNPVGVHLHFSLVKDDGSGGFLNELEIENTLDLSPYFGLPLNAQNNQGEVPACN